jgi:hypothetical protein
MDDTPVEREYPNCPSCGGQLSEVSLNPRFEVWMCEAERKLFRTRPVVFLNHLRENVQWEAT